MAMSSSDRVLLPAGATLDAAPTLLAVPDRPLDDATAALVDRERAAAHAAGHAAGLATGRAEVADAAGALTTTIQSALAGLAAAVTTQHATLAAATETRVLAAARAVLGEEPTEGRRVARAVADAVARVEAPQVQVRVPEALVALVAEALGTLEGAALVADPTLAGEDVRIVAADVDVDLRRARLLAALDEVLADSTPLGPLAPDDVPAHAPHDGDARDA